MDTIQIRIVNLRRLAAKSSLKIVSEQLGYKQPSFLSQMTSSNPMRPFSEKSARTFERKLRLPEGSLDVLPADIQPSELLALQTVESPPTPTSKVSAPIATVSTPTVAARSGKIVEDVISLIDATIAQELVLLDPVKYANLVQLAISDALEHGGQARGSHVQQMVKLLK